MGLPACLLGLKHYLRPLCCLALNFHVGAKSYNVPKYLQRGAKVGAPGSVNMRRKIAFSCLLQAEERNFLPHIHGTRSADFSPPLYLPYPFTKFVNPYALAPFLMRRTKRDPLHCLLASLPSFLADFGWQTR